MIGSKGEGAVSKEQGAVKIVCGKCGKWSVECGVIHGVKLFAV
jgi:hypothetical protein